MKKFEFELQPVLDLRANIEKQWEAKLGSAVSECEKVKNRIKALEANIEKSQKTKHEVTDLYQTDLYEARLKWQIGQENTLLQEKEEIREAVKKEYIKHSVDRKIIEKLKEKKKKEYHKMRLKDEIRFIDELNNSSKQREKIIGGKS